MYDLYSEFDIAEHKKHYFNYLEVIIHPDGSIHYAIPSHQIYLIYYLADQYGETREEFEKRCPREFWADYLRWLVMESKCVSVWSIGYFGLDITDAQRKSLDLLVECGLMQDKIICP